jgi:glycosyltransferase involved in cell wall biosynthesis
VSNRHGLEEYWVNPAIDKARDAIFADLQEDNQEWRTEDAAMAQGIEFFVALPPSTYRGHFVKGLFWSRGVDCLYEAFPELPDFFVSMADSGGCAYPTATQADVLLTQYPNAKRESWFAKKHKKLGKKTMIPLSGEADWINEYVAAPCHVPGKSIDLFCMTDLSWADNLPLIAEALLIARQKYPDQFFRLTLLIHQQTDVTLSGLNEEEREMFARLEEMLVHPYDYLEILTGPRTMQERAQLFSRAKAFVSGRLIGPKPQDLNEAISSNIPVITFDTYNQYARGEEALLIPDGAGVHAEFNPEILADAMAFTVGEHHRFKPRMLYLMDWGRKHFLNKCLDAIPYYQEALPEFEPGAHHRNMWLDLAVFDSYRCSTIDFLYDKVSNFSYAKGLENIRQCLSSYKERLAGRVPV